MNFCQTYQAFQEWFDAAKDAGFDVESWGICGSKSAHDIDGRIKGEWVAAFDTCDGRAAGWIDTEQD